MTEDRLRKISGAKGGMNVPEDYFPEVMHRISSSLPQHPMLSEENIESARVSWWVKVRPIMYMAAMFAGIWLMMKVFTTVHSAPAISIDNPPEPVAKALQNPDNVRQVMSGAEVSDMDIMDSIMDSYDGDFRRFEEEFNKTN